MSMKSLVKGIVIGGPTGIGKTDLALMLAHRLNGELISCDSVQVFSELSIGANKTPTDPIPQHCLDLVHWSKPFTVADFWRECSRVVGEVVAKGKVPILVGGSGFWLDWVLRGRPGAPPSDPSILAEIDAEIKADNDWNVSFQRLKNVDPEYANILNPNDYYRLKRALVVHRMTNLPLSSFKERQGNTEQSSSIDWRCFYLTFRDRWTLLKHIDKRCELMVRKGLIEEVLRLMKNGFHEECQAGRAIGYQETLEYIKRVKELNEEVTEEELDEITVDYLKDFQAQTRQYTRRQEKWFYKMNMFRWIERPSLTEDISSEMLEKVVRMFEADKKLFDDLEWDENVHCSNLKEANWSPDIGIKRRKEMKLYSGSLQVFNDPKDRLELINIIKSFK